MLYFQSISEKAKKRRKIIEKLKGAGRDQVSKRIISMDKIRTMYCFGRPVPI